MGVLGNTKVSFPTDHLGRAISDLVDKTGKVNSFDVNTKRVVARVYHDVFVSAEKANCVEVRYGKPNARPQSIIVTPDHSVLVKQADGMYRWIIAKNLRTNDELVGNGMKFRVISVNYAGKFDVYSMDVTDTECYIGNGIVIYN